MATRADRGGEPLDLALDGRQCRCRDGSLGSSTSAFGSNASTARVRAASTTSGLSTSFSMAAKIAVFAAAMGTFNALAHTDGPRLWWAVHA